MITGWRESKEAHRNATQAKPEKKQSGSLSRVHPFRRTQTVLPLAAQPKQNDANEK